jgi:hypothetical protein
MCYGLGIVLDIYGYVLFISTLSTYGSLIFRAVVNNAYPASYRHREESRAG